MVTRTATPIAKPTVLVTGAAHRLGEEIARHFSADGWHIVVHYRTSANAAQVFADQLPSAETIGFDLADPDGIDKAVAGLAERLDDWRALINCASLFELDSAAQIDRRVFDRAMQTNAEGPARLAQSYLARAKASGGRRVVNVLDQKLANMNPDFFSYTMAKAALSAATEMLAMAHANGPDRIYGLAPGAMLPSHDQETEEHEVSGRMNLLERLTGPGELADAALFLATGTLRTGQTLYVDSGQHLLSQNRDVLFLARENS